MSNEEIILRYWDARWNQRDPALVSELLTPDISFQSPHAKASGLQEYGEVHAELLAAFTQTKVTIEELIEHGDKVATRVELRGVHSGDSLGFPATGKPFRVTMMAIFRLQDGRIAEQYQTYDALDLVTQLGMEVVPA